MTFPGLPLLVGICCFLGLSQTEPSKTPPAPPEQKQVNKLPDAQVLEATLLDMLDPANKEYDFIDKDKLLFAPDAVFYRVTSDQLLDQAKENERAWKKLTVTDRKAAKEAATHLTKRVETKEGFPKFTPKDKRIEIAQEQKQETKGKQKPTPSFDYLDNRPIQAWPPGYSADKQYAIVHLSVPWSMHHADATYILAQRKGKWTVLLRWFVYYV